MIKFEYQRENRLKENEPDPKGLVGQHEMISEKKKQNIKNRKTTWGNNGQNFPEIHQKN